jgi:hypothetical protein
LQNYYVKEFAENLQMHPLVNDVDAWWREIQAKHAFRIDADALTGLSIV